ncbi:MAG: hypothetical protein VW625_05975 [Perlucidibaca sp.]
MTPADHSDANVRALPTRPPRAKLDPRLEELRSILQASEPAEVPADSDAALINDGYLFQKRFGPGFNWPRRHRMALLKLIQQTGLSDREVRLFRHTGNLRRTPRSVELAATGGMALIGASQIGFWGGFALMLAIALALDFGSSSRLPLRVVAAVAVLSGASYLLYICSIKPWITQRRIEQRLQATLPASEADHDGRSAGNSAKSNRSIRQS